MPRSLRPGRSSRFRLRPVSLRVQVSLVLAAMVFATAGVLGGVIGQSSANQLRARIGQTLSTQAAQIATDLNNTMAARSRELTLLGAVNPLGERRDLRDVQALLEGMRMGVQGYLWLGLTDPSGRIVVATANELIGTNFSDRSEQRVRRPRAAVNEFDDNGPAINPTPMTLSHPVRGADGTVSGVMVAQLDWAWINSLASTVLDEDHDSSTRQFFLVSNEDRVLIGPPGWLDKTLTLPAISRARAGYGGWTIETWPDGRDYLTGTGFAAGVGPPPGPGSQQMRWTVLVREDAAVAFQPATDLRDKILVAGFVMAIVLAAIGWLAAGRLSAPLRRIATAADRLRLGDDVELPRISSPWEIRALSESLRALVAGLTSKQLALDEMQTLAHRDPLTGLMNRIGLHAWLRQLVEQDKESGARRSLLLFMGDLDGFKGVNDTHGHPAGDEVLRQVAARMTQWARPGDGVARLGGDEFVVVLIAPRGAADPEARSVIEDMWRAVSGTYDLGGGVVVRIGLTLGGAAWPDDDRRLDGALAKADAVLYTAKRAGKNRIALHREQALS